MHPSPFARQRIFLGAITAIHLASSCPAALTFDSQQIQQSVNAEDLKTTAVFKFKNSGSNPVKIINVQPTCGCTTTQLSKEVYAPGETGEINVIFNFQGRVGPQEKTVYVSTDDERNPNIPLSLSVEIKEPLNCSSRLLFWRIGEDLDEKSAILTPAEPTKIVSVTAQPATPDDITVRAEPLGADGKFQIIARPLSPTKAINVPVSCVATFADGSTHPVSIYIMVK